MHGENMRDRLTSEVTRKQFLQYLSGAILLVFGLDNLISLLTGHRPSKHVYIHDPSQQPSSGFGASKFGV